MCKSTTKIAFQQELCKLILSQPVTWGVHAVGLKVLSSLVDCGPTKAIRNHHVAALRSEIYKLLNTDNSIKIYFSSSPYQHHQNMLTITTPPGVTCHKTEPGPWSRLRWSWSSSLVSASHSPPSWETKLLPGWLMISVCLYLSFFSPHEQEFRQCCCLMQMLHCREPQIHLPGCQFLFVCWNSALIHWHFLVLSGPISD